jgi:hypothetical protein
MTARGTAGFYLVCGIAIVGCAGLVISVIVVIAEGGYYPERYVGGIDPVRAGIVAMLLAGICMFSLFLVGSIARLRRQRTLGSVADGLAWGGVLIAAAGFAGFFMVVPATSGPIALPPALAIATRVGIGLLVTGLVLGLIDNLLGWIRRR